jgi:DNA-binding Lrp family transcriptional regulator
MFVKNTAEIRSLNTKKIIEYFRFNDPVTKKELSEKLGLSFATISNICNQLVEDRVLELTSSLSSSGGRIPNLLSINTNNTFILCLNLLKKGLLKAALVNLKNEIVTVKEQKIPAAETFEQLVTDLHQLSMDMLKEKGIQYNSTIAVGVAASGIFNKDSKSIVSYIFPIL